MANIGKALFRWTLWIVGIVIISLIALFIALQTNYAKQFLTQKIVTLVAEKTSYELGIDEVTIDWFDMVSASNVFVKDKQDSVMFRAQRSTINYSFFELVSSAQLTIEGVSVEDAELNIYRHSDETSLNLLDFLSRLSSKEPKREPKSISLSHFSLKNFQLGYKDLNNGISALDSIFRPNYFQLEIYQILAEDLLLKNDSLELEIKGFSGVEKYSGLPIKAFTAAFGLYPKAIVLSELVVETGQSLIKDSLRLSFNRPQNLSYFKDSVSLFINLDDAKLALSDLRYFGKLPEIEESVQLNGRLNGKLSNLDFENFSVGTDSDDFILFDAALLGLPRLSETFLDFSIKNARVTQSRLNSLSKGQIGVIGDVQFDGSVVGFLNDFVAYGVVNTSFGNINTDINLKLAEIFERSGYRGDFSLKQFDIGSLIKSKVVGKMDFQGTIAGSGFSKSLANFRLSANAQNIEVNGYEYDSVSLNGLFKANFFDGNLRITDDRGSISGTSKIDFSVPKEVMTLNLSIDSLDFESLGVSRGPTWFSGVLAADLQEINFDQMTGEVLLSDVSVGNRFDSLVLNQIKFTSKGDSLKEYRLSSDLVDAEARGDFTISELILDLPKTFNSYASYFIFESMDSVVFSEDASYQSAFDITIKSVNPIFQLLGIPIYISDGSQIEILYKHLSDVSFGIYLSADTIQYRERFFYDNELIVDASKPPGSPDVLALVQLQSMRQAWNDEVSTEDLSVEAIWSQNDIAGTFQIEQNENKNRARIKSLINLKKDTIDFRILPSDIVVFGTYWNINRENKVRFLRDKFIVDELELYNGTQFLSMDGVLSDSLLTQVDFEFVNFDLLNLSTLSPRTFGGVVDAKGRFSRLNNDQPLRVEADIGITELTFEDILIGNLKGQSEWDRAEDGLFIDYSITRQNVKTIDLVGYFRPFQEDQLDLQVSFDQANLNLLEPLFETLISDLEGNATGELSFTGALARPKLRGVSTIENGLVTIDYLNTSYNFSGVTRFFEEQIAFDNIRISDRFNHTGSLNGAINHKQFQEIKLNVSMDFNQFELLNTNRQQNSLYYGNAYATGNMQLLGPAENILITAAATSTQNTRVYIPLIDESSAEQGSFITFKSKEASEVEVEESLDLKGISIDFDMALTPDAYVELIFNPRTGDIIRGKGNGNLQLSVSSSGDFDLFGKYTVEEGAYNFTTSIINKEFQLVPGGSITWFGNPYEGQMDITATYRQLADIQDWNPEDSASQRRPVQVVLDMNGPMLAPEISFELELADQNNVDLTSSSWNRSIATINADEEELKRQVFSLLILRKFSQQEDFIVGGQNSLSEGLTSSVSEFLSNQLSYWLNQVDENLEIDFDINSLSTDAFNSFQLRLAYSFLDGRLRVTRGGGVTTIVDENVNNDLQNIIGDWSIEYILTEDGKWRARFFSRNNQYNAVSQTSTYQQGQETGVSLQYVTSFDEFKEILRAGRKEGEQDQPNPKSE